MVIDSSVLLAYLLDEPGAQKAEEAIRKGGLLLSSVNRIEVKGRLVGMGVSTPQAVDTDFTHLAQLVGIAPFDLEQSDLAADYYARRNPYNLSLRRLRVPRARRGSRTGRAHR